MKDIIERMKLRIMEYQKQNGFETVFDFLNEDLGELSQLAENNKVKNYHFDCWKRDGVLKSKTIKAVTVQDAVILFEAKYPDYRYDPPY